MYASFHFIYDSKACLSVCEKKGQQETGNGNPTNSSKAHNCQLLSADMNLDSHIQDEIGCSQHWCYHWCYETFNFHPAPLYNLQNIITKYAPKNTHI